VDGRKEGDAENARHEFAAPTCKGDMKMQHHVAGVENA